jgi:DUF971 family protein
VSEIYLTEVKRRPEKGCISFTWNDGHAADFDNSYLRGYCPCAGCQGHAAGPVRYQPPEEPVDPVSIQPVGNYGISIQWSDGHATGIYRFEFLRQICPCAECRAERGD